MTTALPPCDRPRDDARAYVDGELPAAERQAFEAHAAACPACREVLAEMVRVVTRIDEALSGSTRSVRDAVVARIASNTSRPAIAAAKSEPRPAMPKPMKTSAPSLSHQSCPKCGATFDVSAMQKGQRFTCGACGSVVTAGESPAGRTPPAPSRAIPAPASPSRPVPPPAKNAPRGPQYAPPDRRTAASAAGRDVDDDPRPQERGSRGAPARGGKGKPGLSTAGLAAISGGFLVFALVGAYFVMKKDENGKEKGNHVASKGPGATKPNEPGAGAGTGPGMDATPGMSGAGTPEADTMASVDADWAHIKHPTAEQYREFMNRYKALGNTTATEKAKVVAKDMIALQDANDKTAHALLGHKEYAFEVPEEISFRKYPFVRAVEEAHAQRWFEEEDAYELAVKAYEKTKAHAQRLETDRVYRALDGARREIDRDEYFKNYNYDAIFAAPYLICYSTEDRIDEEDFIKLSKAERSKKMTELEKKKEGYRRILAEKAQIYPQLYKEFMRRYAEDCELKPLMDEFGGRPDYPASKKSFRDGCPLIVWIFSDKKAFTDYHEKVKREGINPGIAGYFSPATGWVYLYDEDNGDREFEVNKNVHEGTHQLEHWFQRQKNEWGPARVPQSFFGEGFAEYMGSVTMEKDRKLTFVGLNRPRLESLKNIKEMLTKQNQKMFTFPVKELANFEGYGNVVAWAAEHWGAFGAQAGLQLFYVQSWALVYFLNEYENHKYQKAFTMFLDDMLNYPKDAEHYTFEKFKRAMNLKSEEDWKKLDKEFQTFYLTKLATMKTDTIGKKPPSRDDWPGYVEPDPLTPEPAK